MDLDYELMIRMLSQVVWPFARIYSTDFFFCTITYTD